MERDPWAALVADMEKAVNQTVPGMRREFREVLDQVGALKGMVRGLRARVEVLDKDLPGILGKLEAQAEQIDERLTEVGISSPQTPPEDMADLVRYIVRASARAFGVRPDKLYNASGVRSTEATARALGAVCVLLHVRGLGASAIARLLKRDHSTVTYHLRVERQRRALLASTDDELRELGAPHPRGKAQLKGA